MMQLKQYPRTAMPSQMLSGSHHNLFPAFADFASGLTIPIHFWGNNGGYVDNTQPYKSFALYNLQYKLHPLPQCWYLLLRHHDIAANA
ncbi:hypothetical protein [Nitrosomonas sp. wSCUT-2]